MQNHPVFTPQTETTNASERSTIDVRSQALNLAFQMYHTIYPHEHAPQLGADLEILGLARTIESYLVGD